MPKIKLLVININAPQLSQFLDIEKLEEFMADRNVFDYIFFAIFEAQNGRAGKRIHIKIKATEGKFRAVKSIISFIDLLHEENKNNQSAIKDPEKFLSDKENFSDCLIRENKPQPLFIKPGFLLKNNIVKEKTQNSRFSSNSSSKTDLPNGGILEAGLKITKSKQPVDAKTESMPMPESGPKKTVNATKISHEQTKRKKVVVKINPSRFSKSGRQYDR